MPCLRCKCLLLGLVLLGSLPATAVKPLDSPGIRVSPQRPSLTLTAGYIFSGTVKAVERLAPRTNGSAAVMRITFYVNQGLRGTRTGQTLVIREWAGLWQSGDRYSPGERVMLFLYPPSKLGLTSPVGGASGRFPVDPGGQVIIEPRKVGFPTRTRLPEPVRMGPGEFLRTLRSAEEEWQ
ncbi:MAG: hypothetical protein ACLPOO_19890 [Terriglobales bacterium]